MYQTQAQITSGRCPVRTFLNEWSIPPWTQRLEAQQSPLMRICRNSSAATLLESLQISSRAGWLLGRSWDERGGGEDIPAWLSSGSVFLRISSTQLRKREGGRGEDFTQEWGKNHFLSNPEGPNQGNQVVVCFQISFALNVSLNVKCHRSSDQFCCAGPPMGFLVPF